MIVLFLFYHIQPRLHHPFFKPRKQPKRIYRKHAFRRPNRLCAPAKASTHKALACGTATRSHPFPRDALLKPSVRNAISTATNSITSAVANSFRSGVYKRTSEIPRGAGPEGENSEGREPPRREFQQGHCPRLCSPRRETV
jgi:hypothetical protein